MDDEQLTLRKTAFDGVFYDDDWLVIWRGLPIGRILKQSGVAYGKPNWFWSITYHGAQMPNHGSGPVNDLEEGKAQFRAAWADLRIRLNDEDIERFRLHQADLERRSK